MIIAPVIIALQQYLPLYTSLFSNTNNISSLSYSAGIVTAVTSTPHGLSTGALVNIGGALTPNNIVSLTSEDNIATAVTEDNHDLTENWFPNVRISGANESQYNGTFPLLTVPNRKTFTFQLNGTAPSPATGSPQLLEFFQNGYNGYFPIIVINPFTFTYPSTVNSSLAAQGSIVVSSNSRISGAATLDRAIAAYTKQPTDNMWLVLVPGATTVSNDRNVRSDAKVQLSKSDMFWERTIETMSAYVICPATTSIAARRERDLIESEVAPALFTVLCGHKFEKPYPVNPWSRMALTGHEAFEYPGSYYIHQFNFEIQSDITFNLLLLPYTVAFRDIDLVFLKNNEFESPVIMTADINLDDVPLE
jgi:hypothetical protein